MRYKKRTKQMIISYILAFVLMLSLMCVSLLSLGKYSMMSVHGVIHTCERIEYFEGISKEIGQEAYYLGIPYGIQKKDLKGVFSKKQIKKDMTDVVTAQIEGEKPIIKTDDIRKAIIGNVEKQNGTLNEEQTKSLQKYITEVEKLYQKNMIIPTSSYIAKAINIFTKIAWIGIPLSILVAIMCIFFLVSTRKYAYHGLRFVAYGILGAGITLVTVFAAMISDGFIYRFNISDVYMRKFFTFFMGHEMLMQIFAGIGMLLTGAVVIYMVFRQKFRGEI